mgnify:CR=1 FL=1
MELNPDDLDVRDRYKLLIGCVVPRPIAFVSTVSPRGITNLAPYSFSNAVGSNPMTLMFCPANLPDGREKDSLRNARPATEGGTGVFVVNLAADAYARQVAAAAEPLPPDASEFELAGLTPAPSTRIAAPRVAESPVAFECETLQVIALAPGEPAGASLVLGRVVHLHVRDDLLNERFHVDPDTLGAIGRMGGRTYCRTTDRFDMPIGRAALDDATDHD